MRTQQQLDNIKSTHFQPTQVFDYVEDVKRYLDWFETTPEKVYKNTGPVVAYLTNNPVIEELVNKLKQDFGEFDVRSAFIYKVIRPHVIHNDDNLKVDHPYKAFNIPLHVEGDDNLTHLIMFNQFYSQGPAKFFRDDVKDRPVHYNVPITNYENVYGLDDIGISEDFRKEYLTHLKKSWLKGLSINSVLSWKTGSVLEFDSTRLHCSNDWLSKGIKYKIGLSIFTHKT